MYKIRYVLAFTFALTACQASGPTRISYISVEPAYRYSEFTYASGSGEMRTVITGDPFSIGRKEFDSAVTKAMYGHHFGPPVVFTTTPDKEKINHHYSVIMMFDAPPTYGGIRICQGLPENAPSPPEQKPSADQPVYVAAGFCQDDVALTYLAGVMARSGVDDPAFRNYIGEVTMRLFPVFNQEMLPDRDHEFPFPP